MAEVNYENTYWSNKGKYEALSAELNKLVPSSGEVENADDNPALETLRIASNCYYDLYNNGLWNHAELFEKVFGFDPGELQGDDDSLTQELIDRTETKMDEFIILAAHEQHLSESKAETIDITPRGCMTAEGTKRVAQAQQEWEDATHELANYLKNVVDEIFDRDTDKIAKAEYYSELQTLIGIREVKQEAFIRAVVGR